VSPKTQGWCVIAAVLMWMAGCAVTPLAFLQSLPRARVGVVASLASPTAEPVTVTVALPRSYGLAPLEQRAGLDPLNEAHEAEAVLRSEPVEVLLPRISYCVTGPLWSDIPPPPAHFVLRFSNAPDETYYVFRLRDRGVYLVRDSSGLETPAEYATWRLTIGSFDSPDPAGTPERRWLLRIRAERQHTEATEGQAQA
jgi:hypothetical protein